MLIFVDTEFTSLEEPYLISAGLVAADGQELYIEFAGVSQMLCSLFVQETVWPLLDGHGIQPAQAARLIATFLAPFPTATLFSDAPRYDIELLRPFLPPNGWSIAVPSFENEDEEATYTSAYERAFADGLRRHHALDDARAMHQAWLTLHSPA